MKRKCPGRPQRYRWVEKIPEVTRFNPAGTSSGKSDQVNLTLDELEAIRLADLDGLYQEQAAKKLKVSRQTFGRIISSAHRRVADALVSGKSILIDGGEIMARDQSLGMGAGGRCVCPKCDVKVPHRRGLPCQEEQCPNCGVRMMREGSYHHRMLITGKK